MKKVTRLRFGILLVISGSVIALLINVLDFLRGKEFEFGLVQAMVTLVGVLVITVGLIIAFTRISLPPLPHLNLKPQIVFVENHLAIGANGILSKARPGIIETLIIIGFFIFAIFTTLGRWNGITPFIFIGGDASYISSYAATMDHPGYFSNDYFLSNQGNVSSYFALHIPIIRFLNKVTGSYGNAFLFLLPVTIFLKFLGFFILGKHLFKNIGLALLLAIVTYPIVYTGAWDYWGLLGDALPRNLFEIAFPWFIFWSIHWIDKPKRWYLLSFIVGLFAYVHSISAGIIFFTITFVYLLRSPFPILKRVGQILTSVIIFIATITPFALSYISSSSSAQTVSASYQTSASLLSNMFGTFLLDTSGIFFNLVKKLWVSGSLILVLAAIFYMVTTSKKKIDGIHYTLVIWILGVLIISIVIPIIESRFDSWLQLINVRMYLVRGLRYIPPLLTIFIFVVFFDQKKIDELKYPRIFGFIAVFLILVSMGMTIKHNQQDTYFFKEVKCLSTGHVVCPSQKELDAVEIIQALNKYTNPEDRILTAPPLTMRFTPSIRYQALRPMGYTQSDVTRMEYDPVLQNRISILMQPWNDLEHADESSRLSDYLSIALEMRGDYLIIQLEDFSPQSVHQLSPVFQNSHYALVDLRK